MHKSACICTSKHLNANEIERVIVEHVMELCQNSTFVNMTIEELNRDQKEKLKPLEQEAIRLRSRLDELERESDRFVHALGQGTIPVKRLEQEMYQCENDREAIQVQYDHVQRTIQEQAEVLRCLVRDINVYPDKLLLNIFELAELTPGSQSV